MSTDSIGWRSGKLSHDLPDLPELETYFPDNFKSIMTLISGGITYREALFLAELSAQLQSGCIVEVGSFKGRSAIALSVGAASSGADVQIFCIEPHAPFRGINGGIFGPADRKEFYKAMLATGAYKNTALVNLTSPEITPNWERRVSLCFIDGDHSYEGVKVDFEYWSPKIVDGGYLILDDASAPHMGPTKLKSEILALPQWDAIEAPGKFAAFRKNARSQ